MLRSALRRAATSRRASQPAPPLPSSPSSSSSSSSAVVAAARLAPACSCGFKSLARRQEQVAGAQPPADKVLLQAFDSPSSSYTAAPSSVAPTGLFGQPALKTPEDFPDLAYRTTLRAKVLVDRLCRPAPPPQSLDEAERAFLAMVKNLDRLSDLLCGVIDLAELVRNVHPDEHWVDGANAAYEQLCEYMNELNTHVGLYEVRSYPPSQQHGDEPS